MGIKATTSHLKREYFCETHPVCVDHVAISWETPKNFIKQLFMFHWASGTFSGKYYENKNKTFQRLRKKLLFRASLQRFHTDFTLSVGRNGNQNLSPRQTKSGFPRLVFVIRHSSERSIRVIRFSVYIVFLLNFHRGIHHSPIQSAHDSLSIRSDSPNPFQKNLKIPNV